MNDKWLKWTKTGADQTPFFSSFQRVEDILSDNLLWVQFYGGIKSYQNKIWAYATIGDDIQL